MIKGSQELLFQNRQRLNDLHKSSFSEILHLQQETSQSDFQEPNHSIQFIAGDIVSGISERYNLENINQEQYVNLLNELQDLGILTEQDIEYSHTRPMFCGCTPCKEESNLESFHALAMVKNRNQQIQTQLDYCLSQEYAVYDVNNQLLDQTSFIEKATDWLSSQNRLESILMQIYNSKP